MKLATLASLVPGAGASPSPRNATDGGPSPDFGSMLNGIGPDASAEAEPAAMPVDQPAAAAAPATSQAAVGTPQTELLSAPATTDVRTLATRAADPVGSGGLAMPATPMTPFSDAARSDGAAAPNRDGKAAAAPQREKSFLDRRRGSAADEPAQSIATLSPASTIPAVAMQPPAAVAIAALPDPSASAGPSPCATKDASLPVAEAGLADAPVAAMPQVADAAAPIAGTVAQAVMASALDSQIVSGTSRLEGHLGFIGGVRRSVPATMTGSSAGVVDPGRPAVLPSSDAAEPVPVSPAADAASPVAADASPANGPARKSTQSAAAIVASRMPIATVAAREQVADAATPFAIAQAAPNAVRQVVDGITDLVAASQPDTGGSLQQVAPARTMVLQLSPAGLGTLTVRLHVAGRALDVHLEASEADTATMIDRDRDALAGALGGKDYQLQTLSVTTSDAIMPGGNHAERGADAQPAGNRSPNQSADGGASSDRGGGRGSDGAPRRGSGPQRQTADQAVVERGGASLFV